MTAVFIMMKEITALKLQKNNPKRINVFLDGFFSFGISRFVGAWLKVGQKISEKEINELVQKDSYEKALQSAIHLFNFRNRSENEVRTKLAGKGYAEDEINKVIENLKRSGALDDDKFARDWVESRSASKPRGRRLLAYELQQKKVNSEKIDEALQNLPDEITLAIKAADKVVHRYERMERDVFNKKVTAFLNRRGFNFEVIRDARNILWEEARQKIDK